MSRDAYRLTYTLTEMEGNKKVGTQNYALTLDIGGRPAHTQMEIGVPVRLAGVGGTNHYMTEHIGIILDSGLHKFQNGIELSWMVIQTSLADSQQKGEQVADEPPPVTREFDFSSAVLMQENQPVILLKSDIPGSKHIVEVKAELTRLQ